MHTKIIPLAFSVLLVGAGSLWAQSENADSSLAALLDQRVSSALKYEQSIHDAPASVTIVTSAEIERFGYRTLEDVLRGVRGFYITNDRNYSYVGVRGFGRPGDYNNRLLLLLDGHTLNENVYGAAQTGSELGGLDFRSVERVEIVRGPGSALYGTSAMLAVINIVTKEPETASPLRVAVESGSYGLLTGSAAVAKTFDNGASFMVSTRVGNIDGADLYYPEFDDPATNNGRVDGLDWDEYYGVLGRGSYRNFSIETLYTSRDKGIPTGAWGVDFNNDRAVTDDSHAFVELKYENEIGTNRAVNLRAYADRYRYHGTYPSATENLYDASEGNWMGAELQHLWDIQSNNRLIFGVEGQDHTNSDYRLWTPDTTSFYRNEPYTVFSAYVQDEFQPLRCLSIVAGVRADNYSNRPSTMSPRLAVIGNPARSTTVKALYGEAFRVPTFYEQYYGDAGSLFKANPGLLPEAITSYELVWEQDIGTNLCSILCLYRNEFDNLIDVTFDPSDSLFYHGNVARNRASGIDIELRGVVGAIRGYTSYGFCDAKSTDTSEPLTNSPSHVAKLGAMANLVDHVWLGAEALYETGRKTVYGGTTDAYFLLNLHLSTVLSPFGTSTSASLHVRNLFDSSYQTPGGFEHVQPALTQDGRTLMLGLEMKL